MHTNTQSAVRALQGLALIFLLVAGSAWAAKQTSAKAGSKPPVSKTSPKKKPALKTSAKRKSARSRAQTVPTPTRISEIQSALAGQGAYTGDANGKWDDATAQAMKLLAERVPVLAFANNHFAGYAPDTIRQLLAKLGT